MNNLSWISVSLYGISILLCVGAVLQSIDMSLNALTTWAFALGFFLFGKLLSPLGENNGEMY